MADPVGMEALAVIIDSIRHNVPIDPPVLAEELLIRAMPNLLEDLEKAGWVIVPINPPYSLIEVGGDISYWDSDGEGDEYERDIGFENARDAYCAMIQAGKVRL